MPKRREAASWARRRRSLALAKVIIRPCQRLTPLHAKEQGSACRGDSLVGGVGQSRGPSEDDREHHSVFSDRPDAVRRSEEHTSELQSLMRISYAVFCLKKKSTNYNIYI